MCGICGFNWNDEKLIRSMTDSIRHRGPDDEGFYFSEKMTLGHRRLSIIDLTEKGRNPIYNEDRTKLIIFNGEIYNYKELRKDLEKKGHRFITNADTESIIIGYDEYGEKILPLLNGMFTLAIYDIKKEKLVLARDRLGIKPMYYHIKKDKTEDKIIFASEIKAILKSDKKLRKSNEKAIMEYLTFQNTLDNKTFFQDIYQLMPGTYLTCEKGKTTIKKYHEIKFRYNKRKHEATKDFKEILTRAVKRHLLSDVPVGAYLSGGFDSGSVVTIAAKEMKEKINTFTIKFDVKGEFDETECSKIVGQQIGANVYEHTVASKDFIKNFEDMTYHMDEPKVGIPVISQYHLARFVRKKVKVALTGHGGDELFAGYPVFKAKRYADIIKKNPLRAIDVLIRAALDKGKTYYITCYFQSFKEK